MTHSLPARPAPVQSVQPPRHTDPTAAANAYLSYVQERAPEHPEYYTCVVARQAGQPLTADVLERAIREAQQERQSRVRLEGLRVGLRAWPPEGLEYVIEGGYRWPTRSST